MNTKTILIASAMALLAGTAHATTLYSQAFNDSATAYASQNDTSGTYVPLATAYDDFVLSHNSNVNEVDFTGLYFGNSGGGTITGFTLTLYNDNAGAVGSTLAFGSFAGNANQTFIGNFAGFDDYSYSISFADFAMTAGTYWLSLVPDMDYPPQWGWATSNTGTHNAQQSFLNTTLNPLNDNLAFDVKGTSSRDGVPEASTWAFMLVGFGAAGAILRRRRTAVTA